MNEELIAITKEVIARATHYDVPYVKQAYADKLFIMNVDDDGSVVTMTKEQLVGFQQQSKDANLPPLSDKTEFHYAVADGNMGVVAITRELDVNGRHSRRFLTLIYEYLDGRWQIVKETSISRAK